MANASYTRVNIPGSFRVNNPDGFLTGDRDRWIGFAGGLGWGSYGGDPRTDNCPVAWVGNDGPHGMIGPGSWSGTPTPWDGGAAGWMLPAVERCLQLLTNSVVRTPWRVTGADGVELPVPLWLRDPMLIGRTPGSDYAHYPAMHRLGQHDFWSTLLQHAILLGRGAMIFREAADGTPLAGSLRILNPFLLGQRDGVWFLGGGDEDVEIGWDGRVTTSPGHTWRVVFIRGYGPNSDGWAEGVLVRHWNTLRIGFDLQTYQERSFGQAVPAGFLRVTKPDFTPEAAKRLREEWTRAHGGGQRSIAILNSSVDFAPIQLRPTDAMMGEALGQFRKDVALAFNLDPVWVGEGASGLTYNAPADRRRDLVDLSASAWGQKLSDMLTSVMPYGTTVDIAWEKFTLPLAINPATGQPLLNPNDEGIQP